MDKQTMAPMPTPQEEPLIDLRELLRILNHYKWGIASITFVAALISVMAVYSITPTYQATVTILIEAKGNVPVAQVQDVYDPGYGRMEYYGTQFTIIKSRELARRVVERLDLTKQPEFAMPEPGMVEKLDWRKFLPFLPQTQDLAEQSESERAAAHKEWVIAEFGRRLTVEPIYSSQLMKVSFESEDPELAALVANTLAELFIESSLEARLAAAQKASSWLTQKLEGLREDLQKAEQALQAFREQEQLVNVGGERGLVEEELTDNARRLREARKKTAELASAYWKIQQAGDDPGKLEDVSTLLQDDVVRRAKESVLQASETVKQLESRYGPKHPQMIAARARLDAATSAYRTQLITAAKGVKAEYEIARESERLLTQFETGARGTIRGLDRKQYQLRALERDVETNRQLYDMFLARFKETDLTGQYEVLNARVVDPAVPPQRPFKPKKRKIVFLSTLAGLLLGLLLAGLSALLSDMVRSGEELESLTGTPVLGVLPLLGAGARKDLPNQMLHAPRSGFAEGIRSIRTGVLLSDLDVKKKRLVVTSSAPEEGKTTIAINLAVALGQIEKVLLLEGDLRRPSIAAKCGIKDKSPGMIEWLSNAKPLEECIYRHAEANIDILPVGKVPPNPAEILASGRFHKLVELLMDRYDRIIIDSAPCHAVSDTVLLAQNSDGMIFVVQADVTGKRLIRSAIKHLRHARVPIVGSVVNQIDLKRHGHYYASYYYNYGYYA
ncbi:MAG TPA: polysaccharide biosynthesis tyrosine autokinase [Nevskiales bacterium]|nr:polysaccharide biosynthesis tyrosine autokinase [Nevskiales bacterium]